MDTLLAIGLMFAALIGYALLVLWFDRLTNRLTRRAPKVEVYWVVPVERQPDWKVLSEVEWIDRRLGRMDVAVVDHSKTKEN